LNHKLRHRLETLPLSDGTILFHSQVQNCSMDKVF